MNYIEGEQSCAAIHSRTNHAQANILPLEHPRSPIAKHHPPEDIHVHPTTILCEGSIMDTTEIIIIKSVKLTLPVVIRIISGPVL